MNPHHLTKGAIALVAVCSGVLLAEQTAIPLDSQLRRILAQHPLIQSQELMISSRENAARKSLFAYPDPEIQITKSHGHEDDLAVLATPAADRRAIRSSEAQLMQPIPFPGKGLAQTHMMDAAARAERIRLQQMRNRLARDYLTQLIGARVIKGQVEFARETYSRLQLLERTVTLRYETGKTSLSDLSMVRLRMTSTQLAIAQAESEILAINHSTIYFTRGVTEGERRSFTSDEVDALIALIDARVYASAKMIETRSLDVALAREDESAASSADTLAQKYRLLPDLQAFAGFGKEERPSATYQQSMRQNVYRAGITIRVPLWSALTNHWEIADKSEQLKSSRFKVEDAKQRAQADLDASMQRLDGMRKALKWHQSELIPGAGAAHEAAMISYAAGKGDFASVVQSLELHYEHRVTALRMRADLDMELLKAAEILNAIFQDTE